MRHLSVPRAQTQHWLELCRTKQWNSNTAGVTNLEDGTNAIPLNESAPGEGDPIWDGHPHVDIPANVRPKSENWLDHLDEEFVAKHSEELPRSFEIQGDVLIVKLGESIWEYGETMADAMLTQFPHVRLVCGTPFYSGVKGEFRIRELIPLASRDGTVSPRTRVRENGYFLWVDPSKVYFSARLSNQRMATLHSSKKLRNKLGRGLVVADPYAGVGPSMASLLKEPGLLSGYLAGDLNPDAVDLLKLNIEYFTLRRKDSEGNIAEPLEPSEISCCDAKSWPLDIKNQGVVDLLLVNLPHQSIEHIPALLPLMSRGHTTVLRGWAITERTAISDIESSISEAVLRAGGVVEKLSVDEVKGFSMTKVFVCFEAWMFLSS